MIKLDQIEKVWVFTELPEVERKELIKWDCPETVQTLVNIYINLDVRFIPSVRVAVAIREYMGRPYDRHRARRDRYTFTSLLLAHNLY